MPQRKHSIHPPITVGKYLVSPLTQQLACSRFAAAVSIRSGKGSATHDRVLRLIPLFDSQEDAARYALHQGLSWLRETSPLAQQPSVSQAAPLHPALALP